VQIYRGGHFDSEFLLFESLSSLEELEIDWIDLSKMPNKDFLRLPTNCPEKFKVLNVHRYSSLHPKDEFLWEILSACDKLETFRKPKIDESTDMFRCSIAEEEL
jgi:hypothetical protein